MSIHTLLNSKATSYFITFTCFNWLPLIELANAYSSFYKWFEYLDRIQSKLLAYVIMPNHFHGIIYLEVGCPKNINQLVSTGKRFIAYSIIHGLEKRKREDLLQELFWSTSERERRKGQKHKVFKESFVALEIISIEMLINKLDYIHHNPCQGRWMLAEDFTEYEYSSAGYYEHEKFNKWITDYRKIYNW